MKRSRQVQIGIGSALLAVVASRIPTGTATGTVYRELIPSPGDIVATEAIAPDGVTRAQQVEFAPSLFASLASLASEETVEVRNWPVAPGTSRTLRFHREEIYSADAQVIVVDADGEHVLPRPTLFALHGITTDGNEDRVDLVADPEAHVFHGVSMYRGEHYEWLTQSEDEGSRTLILPSESVRRSFPEAPSWTCSQEQLQSLEPRSTPGVGSVEAMRLSSPGYMIVAVDTDVELMEQKFNYSSNPSGAISAAVNYLADVFTRMNVFYERDLNLRLAQGTTLLRVAEPDPYDQPASNPSAQLNEFTSYWGANYASVNRSVAAMFSGKSPSSNSANGIGWVGVLCSTSNGYTFSNVFKINYNAGDASIVGHEIGHNCGAVHTHCPVTIAGTPYAEVDHCNNQESGCYTGPTSCPTLGIVNTKSNFTAQGTLMSYCNALSCSSDVFHDRSELEIDQYLLSASCVGSGSGPGVPPPTVIPNGTPGPTPTPTPTPTRTPTPPSSPPLAPTGVTASDGAYTDRILITWNASAGATSYNVYRNTVDNSGSASLRGNVTSTGAWDSDPTLEPGTLYWYWVRAFNAAGGSPYSNSDSGYRATGVVPTPTPTPIAPTPTPTPLGPAAPTGVSASDGTFSDRVRITWNASANATSYRVFRNTANDSGSALSLAVVTATSYDDSSASATQVYWYWVRAFNAGGGSAYSASNSGYRAGAGPTPTPVPTPGPTPPAGLNAAFTFTPNSPLAGKPVQFTDTSTGATSWQWTFGDGQGSAARNPQYTYAKRGTYTVTLRITGASGSAQTSKQITVGARVRRNFSD